MCRDDRLDGAGIVSWTRSVRASVSPDEDEFVKRGPAPEGEALGQNRLGEDLVAELADRLEAPETSVRRALERERRKGTVVTLPDRTPPSWGLVRRG